MHTPLLQQEQSFIYMNGQVLYGHSFHSNRLKMMLVAPLYVADGKRRCTDVESKSWS